MHRRCFGRICTKDAESEEPSRSMQERLVEPSVSIAAQSVSLLSGTVFLPAGGLRMMAQELSGPGARSPSRSVSPGRAAPPARSADPSARTANTGPWRVRRASAGRRSRRRGRSRRCGAARCGSATRSGRGRSRSRSITRCGDTRCVVGFVPGAAAPFGVCSNLREPTMQSSDLVDMACSAK